jgi:threonine dehydrogenase-like Zn-dependent dehydrogenase
MVVVIIWDFAAKLDVIGDKVLVPSQITCSRCENEYQDG